MKVENEGIIKPCVSIIFFLQMQAYRQGLRYPKYQFLIIGWYLKGWWVEPDANRDLGCTEEERLSVLPRAMGPLLYEFPTSTNLVTEGGLVSDIKIFAVLEEADVLRLS